MNVVDTPPKWDEWFLRAAYWASTKSKVATTKVGAVLVRERAIFATGYNGLPPKVYDDVPERLKKPERYFWESHAERNAIDFCANHGIRAGGAIMYCHGMSCADCARSLIRAGIIELVVHKQWEDYFLENLLWKESCSRSLIMLSEAGVEIRRLDVVLGLKTMIGGKQVDV